MKLVGVELRRIHLPLVTPFRTSFGTQTLRDILLVKAVTPEGEGWGECVSGEGPLYSSEYVEASQHVITNHLLPRLFAEQDLVAEDIGRLLSPIKGHPMAKTALETAMLDAWLRASGRSFGSYLGAVADAVDCGVSVGIFTEVAELLDQVEAYLDQGYKRIKLKIEPGWDIDPVRQVRERFGDILLQVDANTAYTRQDSEHLAQLDPFDLLLIEQPLDEDDLLGHVELAESLQTPICLDESITSALVAAQALDLRACSIVNIKAGRVGGYLESKRIHDLCVQRDIPVWCGGMLESGIGRAANVALAALRGFTLPGDTSASDRYYRQDVTEPFVLEDGQLRVPTRGGLGVSPIPDVLEELTHSTEWIAST